MAPLELGNLNAQRDWGYALDYVKGMHLMLQHKIADDFVLATGRTTTIREFVNLAFSVIGENIMWEGSELSEKGINSAGKTVVIVNSKYFRPSEVELLIGDSSKAQSDLGWKTETTLEEMVKIMVEFDLRNYR